MKVGEVHLLAPKFDEVTYLVSHSARCKTHHLLREQHSQTAGSMQTRRPTCLPPPQHGSVRGKVYGTEEVKKPYLSADKVEKREMRYDCDICTCNI